MATIHEHEIGGRRCTLAYFDSEMRMCEPPEATWAKAVFADGERKWYRVRDKSGMPEAE